MAQAQRAKEETERAAEEEKMLIESIAEYMEKEGKTGVNKPKILSGMKKIMFALPEGNDKGKIIAENEEGFEDENWYNYEEGKWANAQTEDGSMWVWIPRYAYKITYNEEDKSKGGKIDIKFLIGMSDEYYDEDGNRKKAQRAKSETEKIDTTKDYYVHPAFTNERKINYANGGWDNELTGIWVAKFEAGYAQGNNNAPIKASSANYTSPKVYVPNVESESGFAQETTPRNWLDGIYGNSETPTAIKYPTFQGTTYSMNYINDSDAYDISRVLTEDGNIYGLNKNTTDSHLMKNSEWGAVAYLSYSEYGTKGQEIYKNNITLNSGNRKRTEPQGQSGVDSVYAVTGVTTGTKNDKEKTTTIEKIKEIEGNTANSDGVYTWEQSEGQKASSTGNMYGVYDFNGGYWERTSTYIPTIHENLKKNGQSIAFEGNTKKIKSTKYATVYPFDEELDSKTPHPQENDTIESPENYAKNINVFGDAVRETSTNGIELTSWEGESSYYPAWYFPFFYRGGSFREESSWTVRGEKHVPGSFSFCRGNGFPDYNIGFRSVLVATR